MKHSTKTEMKKTHLIKGLFCCVGAIQKYSLQLSSWYVCHIRAQKGNDKCCKYSTAFHERGQPNCVSSGSVPTSPEKFENAALFLRLGLPSTALIRHENGVFENALQIGGI